MACEPKVYTVYPLKEKFADSRLYIFLFRLNFFFLIFGCLGQLFLFPIRLLLRRSPEKNSAGGGNTDHTLLFVRHLYPSYIWHILLLLQL